MVLRVYEWMEQKDKQVRKKVKKANPIKDKVKKIESNEVLPYEWQELKDKLAKDKQRTIRKQLKFMKENYKSRRINRLKEIDRKNHLIYKMRKNDKFKKIISSKKYIISRLIDYLIAEGLTDAIIMDIIKYEFFNIKTIKGKRRTLNLIIKDIFSSIDKY
jgi:hypothetical protein